MRSIIKAVNISKTYNHSIKKVQALHDVNLEVKKGEFLSIMGPSGSGKSTLLSILGLLSPPTTGEVFINGENVYAIPQEKQADFRSQNIGFVFQQFQLIPYLTASENVMLPLVITSRKSREQRSMAEAVLDQVGLNDKYNRLPNQLSGGEQERVAIARAVVNKPLVLFADEPTGTLDTKTGQEIIDLFKSLNKQGITIIMVTHNPKNLEHVKRAVYIKDGFLKNAEKEIMG
jgi:putative ABC transport system ATP-binding protein